LTARKKNIILRAHAKVNLFLELLRRRPDGFHEIETVMQTVSLHDSLELSHAVSGISLECPAGGVPADRSNLAWRAADLMRRRLRTGAGVSIRLTKRIPVGAGLGGGSSDAAAILRGLNVLWRAGLTEADLLAFSAELGSDVGFFVRGGIAVCTGRGEVVSPVPCGLSMPMVIVFPGFGVPTAAAYRAVIPADLSGRRRSPRALIDALRSGSCEDAIAGLFNRLEAPVFRMRPEMSSLKRSLTRSGFIKVLMTGSGSCFFGVCADAETARGIAQSIGADGRNTAFAVRGVPRPPRCA
jgi:4-diphosphocytidyl-2-C-methyl-D-erythritol kinase